MTIRQAARILADHGLNSDNATTADLIAAADQAGLNHPERHEQADIRTALDNLLAPDERRLLNSWNAARHGWDRFQAGSRRATLRSARKPFDYLDDDLNTDTTSTSR